MTPKKPIGPYENPSFQTEYNPGQDIVGHDDRFLRNLENGTPDSIGMGLSAKPLSLKTAAQVVKNEASLIKRFANYIIDQLFLIGSALFIGVMNGLILVYFFPDYTYLLEEEYRLVDYVVGFVIAIIYYSFFEGITGRSLGKFFTKTKVVMRDGGRPDFKTIFVRSLCRYIPFNALSFLDAGSNGWHDRFSDTRVVDIE